MIGEVQAVTGRMRIPIGTGNSKVSCADVIRRGKVHLAHFSNKKKAHGPHCSPENQPLAINKLEQNYESYKAVQGKNGIVDKKMEITD